MLLRYNPLLIYCWLDYNELTWNFQKDKEMTTRQEDIPTLDKIFRLRFKKSILPKQLYNYNKQPGLEDELVELKFKRSMNLKMRYLGEQEPDFLFIGDEPNYRSHVYGHVPYHVFNSPAGMFLLKCLSKLNICFGVVNSKEGNWLLTKKDIQDINPKKIICLGNKSMLRITRLKVDCRLVNHPQFAKRFYGKEAQRIYIDKLIEAMK